MAKITMFTPAFLEDNIDDIRASAMAAGVGNFQPITGEGGLMLCRGVDPADTPSADTYTLPKPLEDEGMANYRARVATAAVGAFNKVQKGPHEAFLIEDQALLHQCRKMNGWPQ